MYQVRDHQALSEGGQGQEDFRAAALSLAWRRHCGASCDSVSQAPPLRSSNLLLACPSGSRCNVVLARPVLPSKLLQGCRRHNYFSSRGERYLHCHSWQLHQHVHLHCRSPALPPDGGAMVWKKQRWTMMLSDVDAADCEGAATAVLSKLSPQLSPPRPARRQCLTETLHEPCAQSTNKKLTLKS